jgi:hypothetical protein
MVAEYSMIFVCQTGKKITTYFEAVQKPKAVSTPLVFLDFSQSHLFIFF